MMIRAPKRQEQCEWKQSNRRFLLKKRCLMMVKRPLDNWLNVRLTLNTTFVWLYVQRSFDHHQITLFGMFGRAFQCVGRLF